MSTRKANILVLEVLGSTNERSVLCTFATSPNVLATCDKRTQHDKTFCTTHRNQHRFKQHTQCTT